MLRGSGDYRQQFPRRSTARGNLAYNRRYPDKFNGARWSLALLREGRTIAM